MLTLEQAKEYLAALGMSLPDSILQLIVDQINTINECLEEHYPEPVQSLIRLYLLRMFGIVNTDKYVTSEHAPSGASRSYAYRSWADAYRMGLGQLKALDPYGCATGLIPPDPTAKYGAALFVGTGKNCRCRK